MTPAELQRVLERRAERAALAAAAARRNLPSSLLLLSGLLLAVAAATLAWAWGDRAQAVTLLNARLQQAEVIQKRAVQIIEINTARKQVIDDRARESFANQGGPLRLQEAALSDTLRTHLASQPAKESVASVESGLALRSFTYNNLQHSSIGDILGWIENARRQIPGLEIQRFTLRPTEHAWNFSIVFVRYEKKEG